MPNANKNKGKGFERQIAKHLSAVTGFNFERVPNSGAFVGGKNFHRTEKLSKEQTDMFEGDILVPAEWNKFRIECKFYKSFSWEQVLTDESNAILKGWIEQAKAGTRPHWFLIFKINFRGEFIVFPKTYNFKYLFNNFLEFSMEKEDYIIVSMKNFFENNKYTIEQMNKENVGEKHPTESEVHETESKQA